MTLTLRRNPCNEKKKEKKNFSWLKLQRPNLNEYLPKYLQYLQDHGVFYLFIYSGSQFFLVFPPLLILKYLVLCISDYLCMQQNHKHFYFKIPVYQTCRISVNSTGGTAEQQNSYKNCQKFALLCSVFYVYFTSDTLWEEFSQSHWPTDRRSFLQTSRVSPASPLQNTLYRLFTHLNGETRQIHRI